MSITNGTVVRNERAAAGWLVRFDAPPPEVVVSLRTVAARFDPTATPGFDVRARGVLGAMIKAAQEQRLCLIQCRHEATGDAGLLVAETSAPFSAPDAALPNPEFFLAEFVHPGEPPELADATCGLFEHLLWTAVHGELMVVIHAPTAGSREGAAAFGTRLKQIGREIAFLYFVRLFVDQSEVDQWRFE